MKKRTKQRLVPYKLLAFLLYGEGKWLLHRENLSVMVNLGVLSKTLQISNSRCLNAIEYLKDLGLIFYAVPFNKTDLKLRLKQPE